MRNCLLIILIFVSCMLKAQDKASNQLVIEVTTDGYPKETNWMLYDAMDNLISSRTAFEKETIHRDTIMIDSENCYYWKITDDYGEGMSGPGNSDPGDFKLYMDGVLIHECADPDFGKEFVLYSIGNNCSLNDIKASEFITISHLGLSENRIKIRGLNMGAELINSMEIQYSIDDEVSQVANIDNLAIEVGEVFEIEHPEIFLPKTAGIKSMSFSILTVNGRGDAHAENNSLQKSVTVLDGYLYKPMHEVFTSSTCPPCYPANEYIDAALAPFPGYYSLIKYQVNFPGAGDPYFIEASAERANYYNVQGAPSFYVNGLSRNTYYTPSMFDDYIGQIADYNIQINAQANNDSISASIIIDSKLAGSEGLKLHVAVVENTTFGNADSNGETEFHNVIMAMLPGSEGTELPVMIEGERLELTFEHLLFPSFVEEMTDLQLVAFIQNESTKEVLQSEMVSIDFTAKPSSLAFNFNDGETGVATDTCFVISANTSLRNVDGTEISSFANIISLKELDGTVVEFEATLNDLQNEIIVKPVNALKELTWYALEVKNLENEYNAPIIPYEIQFETIKITDAKDYKLLDVEIYPNPVSEHLYVKSDLAVNVSIINMAGVELITYEKAAGKTMVELYYLEKGMYIIKVWNSDKEIHRKIIKL